MPPDQLIATASFWTFAVLAVACSVGLLASRHPIKGAVCLIGVMLSLAGLYAVLHSPFIAVLQVLVYAGAIMMLVVFVIMVLNQGEDHAVPRGDRTSLLVGVLPLLVCAIVVAALGKVPLVEHPEAARGGLQRIAATLFDTGRASQGWWLLFELGGLLLLAAVVGAVLLAKRRLDTTGAGSASDASPSAAHPGHADRGASLAAVHDRAAAATTTVAGRSPGGH